MYNIYKNVYNQTAYLEEQSHKYNFYFSICRSVLQLSSICAIEMCWEYGGERDQEVVSKLSERMIQPSDGDFFEVLDKTIYLLRVMGWKSCAASWFDLPPKKTIGVQDGPLNEVVRLLNKARNDRSGHGVVDSGSILAAMQWLPEKTWRVIDELKDLLPIVENGLVMKTPIGDLNIRSIFPVGGNAIVIRRYKKSGVGWRAQYQVLDPHESKEGYLEIDQSAPLISSIYGSKMTLKSSKIYVHNTEWNPAHIVPYKLTETFEGRGEQITELLDWWNDKDSRTCLVYGEGGIGKTTLVLEFLNDIFDSSIQEIEWLPELIYYYSAKQTRWGVSGLEHLSGVVPSIAESIRTLVSILDDSNIRGWMKEDPRKLIDKTAGFLSDIGLSRNQILIVLDNTETLARSQDQVDDLAKILRQISSKLGRVLITSRRREKIEAFPVQVPQLEEQTGAVLLRRLGKEYEAQALVSAGESTLRKATGSLSGKPLLIDVLARQISNSGSGIDEAVLSVLKQSRSDLGEFLFEDAWSRMNSNSQLVFLIIGQMGGAIADKIVAWTCAEIGVQLDDWLESFSETKFGTLNDYGANFDIHLNPDAREYLIKKYSEANGDNKAKIELIAKSVRSKYEKLLRAEISDVTDRVAIAFRSSAAKAAKFASMRGNVEEAIMWFEEAVTADPGNHALLDRFAYFLMNKDPERAYGIAVRACQAGPKDADAHFTAGMIAARMSNMQDADKYLDLAKKHGKENHLCLVQKAWGKINYSKNNNLIKQQKLLKSALEQVKKAVKKDETGRQYKKHLKERDRIIEMINHLLIKIQREKRKNQPKKEPIVIYKNK